MHTLLQRIRYIAEFELDNTADVREWSSSYVFPNSCIL